LTQLAVPGFPPNPVLVQDEFACLNLNILKPDTEIAGLPVMVWIHGGGLAVGSNSELVYTGKELVRRSMKAGMPVIHVAINYRLGPFGFLSSKQLLEENGGKAVGNYGLWDQRLALQFVSDHISAFGGDPNRVTIFGESAGGGWFLPLNISLKR
jgi:carboxylesterase type B